MAFAASLIDASNLSYAQLALKWQSNLLAAASSAFSQQASPIFQDVTPNSRPVGNWFVLLDALGSTLPPTNVAETDFNQMVEYVARMCYAASTLNTQTPQMVTNAQAAALLAAWNSVFGT